MKFCVISSSGGSSLKSYLNLSSTNSKILLITDRLCGSEELKNKKQIYHKRINSNDINSFCEKVIFEIEKFGGVDFVLLFFTKLIAKQIYSKYLTFNLHSSLLPSFPGFNSILKAFENQNKYIGVTLHLVDSSKDNGKIIAQTIVPTQEFSLNDLKILSFIQNVILIFILEELVTKYDFNIGRQIAESGVSYSVSPAISEINNLEKLNLFIRKKLSNESKNLCNNAANIFALDRVF